MWVLFTLEAWLYFVRVAELDQSNMDTIRPAPKSYRIERSIWPFLTPKGEVNHYVISDFYSQGFAPLLRH